MSRKVLSVSIAAYNAADYVREAINSLLIEDTYRNKLDIIIVNDGSQDDTLKIIRQYEDNYPDCIRVVDKSNGGYGSTINASLTIADGVYYKLLDSDDWFNQDELRSLIDYLENQMEEE